MLNCNLNRYFFNGSSVTSWCILSLMKSPYTAYALSFACCVLLLAQTGDIPQYEGDDNPNHNGQPKWCQARDENGFKKNCGICNHQCDGRGVDDHKCKVFCRAKACKCNPGCERGH